MLQCPDFVLLSFLSPFFFFLKKNIISYFFLSAVGSRTDRNEECRKRVEVQLGKDAVPKVGVAFQRLKHEQDRVAVEQRKQRLG